MSEQLVPKGLDGVVVDKTEMSMVDGARGILVYRGYNIDEIANCSFEEICHLFLEGELPNRGQLAALEGRLCERRQVPESVLKYIQAAPLSENPMGTLRTAVSMLSGYMPHVDEVSAGAVKENAIALISQVATIAAAMHRVRQGMKIVPPHKTLGYSANYLYMMRGEEPQDVVAKTLNTALVLHADHGFNASTFTARVVISTLTDIVSAVTAAIGSLKGPLHGGANTAVMEMLMEIGEIDNVEPWIEDALAQKKKIMGFGHRVYKVLDPRAKHLKQMSKEWGERAHNIKWFTMSEKIEDLMMKKKGLNANVDFYSASTYYAMGIPAEMFTVIFAVARTLGWTAHVIEQLADNRLMRPEALYVGRTDKKFVPIDAR
jgi:citrate synthase